MKLLHDRFIFWGCTDAGAHHLNVWSLNLGYGLYVSPVAAGLDSAMVVLLHASLVWEMSYFLATYKFSMCHHGFRMWGLVECGPW